MVAFVGMGFLGFCFSLQIYANILTWAMTQGKKDTNRRSTTGSGVNGMNNPMDQCHPCSEQRLFHHQLLCPRGRGGDEGDEVGAGGVVGKVN